MADAKLADALERKRVSLVTHEGCESTRGKPAVCEHGAEVLGVAEPGEGNGNHCGTSLCGVAPLGVSGGCHEGLSTV